MPIKNTETNYGWIAISLHWLMAVLLIGLLCLGLYMTDLPSGSEQLKFYGWHKEFGALVLIVVGFRIAWRFINITPLLNLPWFEKLAARLMHGALYIFMIAMPLSGWLMSSAAGYPISFFGLFTLPMLIDPNPELKNFLRETHEFLAYVLIGLIGLHTLAALKHHFFDKDDILQRIIK